MNPNGYKGSGPPRTNRIIRKECRAVNLHFSSVIAVAFIAGVSSQMGWATSSGLNNIPTADTAPNLTLVFQGYSLFGTQRSPDHFAAFKFGIDPWETKKWRNRFEVGLDSRAAPGDPGPSVFQAKWATQIGPRWPAFSLGVANLASTVDERYRAGAPFSFVVLSEDLKLFRLHGGYALQAGRNNTALLGLDKTFTVFRRAFILHTDAIQTDHQENWAASFGGLYEVWKTFAVESWITQPIHGRPPSFIVKVDVGLRLKR